MGSLIDTMLYKNTNRGQVLGILPLGITIFISETIQLLFYEPSFSILNILPYLLTLPL